MLPPALLDDYPPIRANAPREMQERQLFGETLAERQQRQRALALAEAMRRREELCDE
jgi:hypothetical protein